ncbi:hypothetical protein CBS115989_1366 [Aspergillus niger]|uniref:Contig An03c0020, genomic contig n=4 Tax=Aspergillus niger TaxID=5061 RepID=A2QFS5_ASPNC|nr:uncharacterized protein An03g00600 [Aspergillus niger]XP_025453263.1 uncharacterized protein BO96DRAFT_477787 [Aspergillus niger CBS 101883]EHA20952.1 hypothetical protein ASPNIDRAFT_45795 [Aspergillus niger ATCC 1015]RDH19626.1 hypothetical protein M747DRAFT_239053 [Aspergillus niger ATCC 13496]KAI2823384.1 hypothetical protein CBS115989_1366 [Aspergillus niger]KAI2857655.1 hypothetical protein CBS11232_3027 [Aspergillus niger]KAI2877867.1 hypothetical protein CBS115988_3525 [Aspergillus |eukprot:XP_001389964.1 hypothetical protein ANI_1_968034 [Aspergillus niger CBS 513.88]
MATNLPNHRIVEDRIYAEGAFLVIISRAVLFEITLRASDFFSTSLETHVNVWLSKAYASDKATDFDEAPDDGEVLKDFWDWLVLQCAQYIRHNAPVTQEPVILQRFTFPQTHAIQLLPINGLITAVPINYKRFSKSSLPTISALISGLPPSVLKLSAADVLIYPEPDNEFDHTCDIPRRVQVAERSLFFKSAINTGTFISEVSVLSRVSELGLSINVSKIYAIVLSENEKIIIGILIGWLPFRSRNLWSDELIRMKNYYVKWERQILDTVKVLHSNDIVWGDVHPGNIVIDYTLDAWVVDFDGGYRSEFVDGKSAGTKQGDLEGIRNVFCKWLPQWYLELQRSMASDAV